MIVPVYNKRAYLESSVKSLRAQTYANLEIILVDDGSTDGSGELCEVFAREDSRIRVIHQANGGVSSARNAGLDAALGKYVCFVDGDDQVLETMVEEMAAILDEEDCDLCVGGIAVRDEKDGIILYSVCYPKPAFFQFPTLRERQRFLCRWILCSRFGWSACSQLWRRDVIECHHLRFKAGQKIYEDMDFFFRYVARCRNLRYIPKVFYMYQQHADSVINTSGSQDFIYWMLRLARSWNDTFEEEGISYPPDYICAGVTCVVCRLMRDIPRTEADKRQLAQVFDSFRTSENGEWLQGQARLAVRNWAKILRICGLGLGLRVYGFYKTILTGDMSAFHRVNQLRIWYEILYEGKRIWLSGSDASR